MDYSTSRQEPSTLIWSSDFVMTKILNGPAVSWNWVGALKTSNKLGMHREFSEWELWENYCYVRHKNKNVNLMKIGPQIYGHLMDIFEWEHDHFLRHVCIDMCEEWSHIYIDMHWFVYIENRLIYICALWYIWSIRQIKCKVTRIFFYVKY